MNTVVLFSKKSDEWATPAEFFSALDAHHHFGVDAAATQHNRKCHQYYGLDHAPECLGDALHISWRPELGVHWCNPPYSQCRAFVAKAVQESLRGVQTVMLVPSRTDTRWFHEYLWDASRQTTRPGIHLDFVRGRLKFGEGKNSAPFPSMVITVTPIGQSQSL